jgi:hypothetical protein
MGGPKPFAPWLWRFFGLQFLSQIGVKIPEAFVVFQIDRVQHDFISQGMKGYLSCFIAS